MEDPKKPNYSSSSVTLDASWRELSSPQRRVELVEGSGPKLTGEIQRQLQCRLRLASLVMFFGFGVFWIRNLLWPGEQAGFNLLFLLHGVVTLTLGTFGITLCRRRSVSMNWLRFQEILVFGLPAVFFLVVQYGEIRESARQGFLPSIASTWLLLMFTYAFLIPNWWGRAVWGVGAMVLAPMSMLVWLLTTDEDCQQALNGNSTYLTNQILILFLGSVVAVVGVRTIRLLRHEAFEAKQLGKYHLRRLIGRGGMGEVYLAEHRLMSRPCAIKVVQPDRLGDARSLARFEREVETISQLSHWNSVDIYDFGRTEAGTFYYVMEYLPGMSLQELVDRFGPLPSARIIHLLTQTCEALTEAHHRGLIHRDIKPANLFAAERGGIYDVAKLLDFGLAKPVLSPQSVDLTEEGLITGSPFYMSPEQGLGDEGLDGRSDIYSLGAVAYFLATGHAPFEHEKPLKVILAHAHEEVVPPRQRQSSLSPDLEAIIVRCLAKDPRDRFQSAAELAEALSGCLVAGEWSDAAAAEWWRRESAAPAVAERLTLAS